MLLVIDLIGVFRLRAGRRDGRVRQRLDLFGVLVLSFATATAGGILRDLLIGAVPPPHSGTGAISAVGACSPAYAPFSGTDAIERLRDPVRVFDAPGLGLFAVAGTQKALHFGLHPVMAALLGMLTGIGGGVMRDLLLSKCRKSFQSDIYALAALAGAVVVLGDWLQWPAKCRPPSRARCCVSGCAILAMWFNWHLPSASGEGSSRRE